MSKGTIIYALVLCIVVGLAMAGYEHPENWTKSFAPKDKNPYGSFALSELAPDLFDGRALSQRNLTLYEMLTGSDSMSHVISISEEFMLDDASYDKLLAHVAGGYHAFIAAQYFDYRLTDTLDFTYFEGAYSLYDEYPDSTLIYNTYGDTASYVTHELYQTLDSMPINSQRLVYNATDMPVAATIPFGQGNFTICTVPIVFTNFFLLYEDNGNIPAQLLSEVPNDGSNISWTTYYQLGALRSGSPFREILKIDALRDALYLTIFLVLTYLIVGSKRMQRAIPIVKALPNQTLDFIKTVGQLYFHTHDHYGVARHKINFFSEYLKSNYRADIHHDGEETIAKKAGIDITKLQKAMASIRQIEHQERASQGELIALHQHIQNIYKDIRIK